MQRSTLVSILFTLLLAALLALILSQAVSAPTPAREDSGWAALLQTQPLPLTQPLPSPVAGPFDGVYAKLVSEPPMWWKCLRCADYRVSGGLWKLQFAQGVMRLYYDVTGWHSLASFLVSGDQLTIFNDPWCPDVVGRYTWKLTGGALQLTLIEDTCAFRLRAATMTEQPWAACASGEAIPGCQDNPPPPQPVVQNEVTVTVHGGDSRFFPVPPDLLVPANLAYAPEGIRITYSPESVSFGLTRILWWEGNWIEAATAGPFTAIGVQFLGEAQIGWARVYFDGLEVWNGKTADLAYQNFRHGGYVEISGFSPGAHTLRVESWGLDYRPVTVASFGFSEQGRARSTVP